MYPEVKSSYLNECGCQRDHDHFIRNCSRHLSPTERDAPGMADIYGKRSHRIGIGPRIWSRGSLSNFRRTHYRQSTHRHRFLLAGRRETGCQGAAPGGEVGLETALGSLVIKPPNGIETGVANLEIGSRLRAWWSNHCKGQTFDSSTGQFLPNGEMMSPDCGYALPEQIARLPFGEQDTIPYFCPAFVMS